MKAITVRQPWAWLIIYGGKDIENRSWSTAVRGRVLVHASKGMTLDEYDSACFTAQDFGIAIPDAGALDRGGIIGSVEIVRCVPPRERHSQWHEPGQWGFQLREPRALPFLPCSGALGFWGNFEVRDGKAVQL